MEVHAHSHTDRKKWHHYFWEFFMLFLAIVLGFLVENRREHFVEHQREKRYAQLLFEDLKKDTTDLRTILQIKEWRVKKLDTLFYFLEQSDLQAVATEIYYYSACAGLDIPFKPNDATIQQLRSSGSLRYFNNPKLYNSIAKYYSDCTFYQERETEGDRIIPATLATKLFQSSELFSIIKVTHHILDAVKRPSEKFHLRTTDPETINEFVYYIKTIKTTNDVSTLLLHILAGEQNELIAELKKEYRLK